MVIPNVVSQNVGIPKVVNPNVGKFNGRQLELEQIISSRHFFIRKFLCCSSNDFISNINRNSLCSMTRDIRSAVGAVFSMLWTLSFVARGHAAQSDLPMLYLLAWPEGSCLLRQAVTLHRGVCAALHTSIQLFNI